jgi:type II secretory pathway component PulF
MNQIKSGVKLKTVSSNPGKSKPVVQMVEAGGLAGALSKALEERGKALQQTDESSSENEDDKWDDT